MTARREIGMEAAAVFQALTLGETVDHTQHLLVAPHCLQNKLLDMIDDEICKGAPGRRGLSAHQDQQHERQDPHRQADRSQPRRCAGGHDRAGHLLLAGRRSRLDRQHPHHQRGGPVSGALRIYIFGSGDVRVYIGSADWMTRNTLRRVEVAVPVYDQGLKQRLLRIFDVMWRDNRQARDQQPDGSYAAHAQRRARPGLPGLAVRRSVPPGRPQAGTERI